MYFVGAALMHALSHQRFVFLFFLCFVGASLMQKSESVKKLWILQKNINVLKKNKIASMITLMQTSESVKKPMDSAKKH